MIKKHLCAVVILGCVHFQGIAESDRYETLCTNVAYVLSHKRILLSPIFTNQISAYLAEGDVRIRSLAGLTMSISLFDMFETSLKGEYDEGCRFCTNVLYSADLPARSWQKSVASILYASALHLDGKKDLALAVCNTALTSHLTSPTTAVECAVWSAMSKVDGVPEMSITNSLKLAAALSVPAERRSLEWYAYTNGLPAQAIQILLE